MPFDPNAPIGISSLRAVIGDYGGHISAYYKTPGGPTPTSYPNVSTGGTIALSMFRAYSAPSGGGGGMNGSWFIGGGTQWNSEECNNASSPIPDYYGNTTAPQGAGPVGYLYSFIIPNYNTLVIDMSGAGGTSGESIWDPSDVFSRACVAAGNNGPLGQNSFLLRPDVNFNGGSPTQSAGFQHTYGRQVATVYSDATATGDGAVACAGGGGGGGGASWNGACDGRSGGSSSYANGGNSPSGISGNFADSRDAIVVGGGAGGGGGRGYLGRGNTQGGNGGAGSRVVKYFQRGGLNAPAPGAQWYIYLGFPNPLPGNGGGWNRGFPSYCNVTWS